MVSIGVHVDGPFTVGYPKDPRSDPDWRHTLRTLAILTLLLLLGGCAMAGTGVASATARPKDGTIHQSTYNDQWVYKPQSELDSLDVSKQKLEVVDISKRELGVSYLDPDVASGKYESEADKKIAQRLEARQAAWNQRLGIKTIKDEQEARK